MNSVPVPIAGYSKHPLVISVIPSVQRVLLREYGKSLVFADMTFGMAKGNWNLFGLAVVSSDTGIILTSVLFIVFILTILGLTLLCGGSFMKTKDVFSYHVALLHFYHATNREWKPTEVMVDFEEALHQAFKLVWPDVHLRGCFFHHQQCIRNKIKGMNLKRL